MRQAAYSRSHRIVVMLSTHTETWYSKTIPQVGKPLMHRGVEFEVVGLRMDGKSYVIEVEPGEDS